MEAVRQGGSALVVYGADDLETRSQAYGLLSLAAEEHWGLSPLPELVRSPLGKPSFSPARGREFNLSHSGRLALCALDEAPVGVDIQVVKSWRPSLPGRVCSPEELAWLEGREDFWPSFTALWALKESRAKQSGQGLRGAISAISVPIPQGGDGLFSHQGLWFRLWTGPDWAGAVCALNPPPQAIQWRRVGPSAPDFSAKEHPHRKDRVSHDL